MKHILHVNQHNIRANLKLPEGSNPLPVLSVRTYKGVTTTNLDVVIDGPCRLVYRPDKPLGCGARVWIETTSTVHLEGAPKK